MTTIADRKGALGRRQMETAGWLMLAAALTAAAALPRFERTTPRAQPAIAVAETARAEPPDIAGSGGKRAERLGAADPARPASPGLLLPAAAMMPLRIDWLAAKEAALAQAPPSPAEAAPQGAAGSRRALQVLPPPRAPGLADFQAAPQQLAGSASVGASSGPAPATLFGVPVPRPLAAARDLALDAAAGVSGVAAAALDGAGRLLPRWTGGNG